MPFYHIVILKYISKKKRNQKKKRRHVQLTVMQSTIPTLIIVSGLPGTGKSTLSNRLAAHFALPLIQKDMIKETLCDILGCTTLSQSQLYGRASMALLYQFAEVILMRGQNCIIESTFHPGLSMQDLDILQQRCPFSSFQIYCYAEIAVLSRRVQNRWESGERHPGHMEQLRSYYDQDHPIPQEYLQPLPLNGRVIELDTTDFANIDYEYLFAQIQTALSS
jgi:predicted kinase